MGWMIVAYDLPVKEQQQRIAATRFRKFLLNDGFQMLQYSVYARSLVSHARMQTRIRRLKSNLPPEGSIRAIFVTQSQWEKSFVIYGQPMKSVSPEALPEQLRFW